MKNYLKLALTISLLLAMSCAKTDYKVAATDEVKVSILPTIETPKRSFEGQWKRCDLNGNGNYDLVTVNIKAPYFSETIGTYSASDCSGTPMYQPFYFNGYFEQGTMDVSTNQAGATDLTFIPTTLDAFGCGINQRGYTYAVLSPDGQKLLPMMGTPSCDPNNIPQNNLDNGPLIYSGPAIL